MNALQGRRLDVITNPHRMIMECECGFLFVARATSVFLFSFFGHAFTTILESLMFSKFVIAILDMTYARCKMQVYEFPFPRFT